MEETFEETKTFILYIERKGIDIEVEAIDQTQALKMLLVEHPRLRKYDNDFLLENLGVMMS